MDNLNHITHIKLSLIDEIQRVLLKKKLVKLPTPLT